MGSEYKDDIKEEEEEEEEEALSLCDLPLEDDHKKEISEMANHHNRRSSSEPPEFFEFLTNFNSEIMCSAEDIIFRGKLVPFKHHKSLSHQQHQDKRHLSFRRRSESLSGLHYSSVPRSNSINNTKLMMRNSRSLDYRKLERFSGSKTSPDSSNSFERNSSATSVGRDDNGILKRTAKPRWYVLMFGVVKPPTEMELRDIKSRQGRRNSSTMMFPQPAADSVKKPPVSKGSTSCRLLKVLSCRDNTSVAVTASFCMPSA